MECEVINFNIYFHVIFSYTIIYNITLFNYFSNLLWEFVYFMQFSSILLYIIDIIGIYLEAFQLYLLKTK